MMLQRSFLTSFMDELSAEEQTESGQPTALISIHWISTSGLQLNDKFTYKSHKTSRNWCNASEILQ